MSGKRTRLFKGIAASPGIGVGRAQVMERHRLRVPRCHILPGTAEAEIDRLRQAVRQSLEQVNHIRERMARARKTDPAAIIQAQALMLQDEVLLGGTEDMIRRQAMCAEWALQETLARIRGEFDRLEDGYLRERRSDINFVGQRILRNLLGLQGETSAAVGGLSVMVAHDLSPVDTAGLNRNRVVAFVTEAGGKTSHTTIIARSLELPAVVGAEGLLKQVGQGDRILVDGYRGEIWLHPAEAQVQEAIGRGENLRSCALRFMGEGKEPVETRDGHLVRLSANLEMVEEAAQALRQGAEGVGLFRTEYLFLRRNPPGEGQQRHHYQTLLRRMQNRPVTIRTLDLGGDKRLPFLHSEPETNPALGLRSIRLSLRNRTLFLTQLRALLRASVHGNLRIMFPMISCLRELQEARAALEEAKEQLRHKGQPFQPDIKVGMMVEVPSAAVMADIFARQVDFFSVGTNDLVQYLLAADRQNEQVAYLFNPLHPSVLRMLHQVVRAARGAGIPVAICGEMAGDPLYLLVVLGLGFDEVSMNPIALPFARHLLRSARLQEAHNLVRDLLGMEDNEAIRLVVQQWMAERFPDLFTEEGPTEILGGL